MENQKLIIRYLSAFDQISASLQHVLLLISILLKLDKRRHAQVSLKINHSKSTVLVDSCQRGCSSTALCVHVPSPGHIYLNLPKDSELFFFIYKSLSNFGLQHLQNTNIAL